MSKKIGYLEISFTGFDITTAVGKITNYFEASLMVRMAITDGNQRPAGTIGRVEVRGVSIDEIALKAIEAIFNKDFCSIERYVEDFALDVDDINGVQIVVRDLPENMRTAIKQAFDDLYGKNPDDIIKLFSPKQLQAAG